MATITSRPRADGSASYTAQIRIRRKGSIIYQESKTFDQRRAAERWANKREAFIDEAGVETLADHITIGDACAQYVKEVSSLPRGIGQSKLGALKFMQKQQPLADLPLVNHTSAQLMDWMNWRTKEGASPATVNQDLIFLKQVLEYARAAWSKPIDLMPLQDVKRLAAKHGVVDRSRKIDRRPELDELSRLIDYFKRRISGKGAYTREHRTVPMVDIILFQIFSTRRIAETYDWSGRISITRTSPSWCAI